MRLCVLAAALASSACAMAPAARRAEAPRPAETTASRIAAFPAMQSVERVDAYQPAETVKGGRGKPFAPALAGAIDPTALDRAEAYAQAQGSFAFIVARDGRIVRERYWDKFGPDSRFSTASMHKTVLALAFGPAVARGLIALDQPVSRYLPEWRNDPRGAITIRQLLSMSGGLEAPFGPSPEALGMRLMFGTDIRAAALEAPQVRPAGQEFAYANVSSQLAGEALTRAIGRRYSAWLSRAIWAPIGADDAALWLDRPGGSPHYFCCLQASARDWVRVGELIRNRGRAGGRQIVPADWIAQMAAPSPLNPNYGLQLWRGSPYIAERRYARSAALVVKAAAPFAADDVLFLDGAGGQRVYVVPSAGLTIVRIGKPSVTWDDSAMPNMVFAGVK